MGWPRPSMRRTSGPKTPISTEKALVAAGDTSPILPHHDQVERLAHVLYRAFTDLSYLVVGAATPVSREGSVADLVTRLTKATTGSVEPGETILHGAVCMPVGGLRRRSLSAALGGVIGVLANTAAGAPADHSLDGAPLPHDLAVALTDRRVLLVAMSTVTGRPSRVVADVPLSDLKAVEVTGGTSFGMKLHRFTLSFSDGSSLALESRSRGHAAEGLCAALSSTLNTGANGSTS
jgi:hypothetical protein